MPRLYETTYMRGVAATKSLPPVLITTKLKAPREPQDAVERTALLQRAVNPGVARLTLICASAGAGKSMLAAQWASRLGDDHVWLSLGPEERDPMRFARYLVVALQQTLADELALTRALLDAVASPPWAYFVEVLVAELARIDRPLTVFIDDYHLIESESSDLLVTQLVEHLSETLHLVVLSRSTPSWPLGLWRSRGWLREVGDRDISFSLDETRRFLEACGAGRLKESSVERLQHSTEGWIAGLRLAALSLSQSERPDERAAAFRGSDFRVADFLLGEVLASEPPATRELMAVGALLGEFCTPLCEHVLYDRGRHADAGETFDMLVAQNHFILPTGDDKPWYRFHHLLSEFLIARADELISPEVRERLDQRAAEWFEEHGLVEAALRHWVAAGEIDRAADLLGKNIDASIAADPSRRTLGSWLALFPSGAERGRLPLLVAHGCLRIVYFDTSGLGAVLAQVGRIPRIRDTPFYAHVEGLRARFAYWSDDPKAALQHARNAIDAAPPVGSIALTHGHLYVAVGLAAMGRRPEALRFLAEAVAEVTRSGGDPSYLLVVEAIILLNALELDDVKRMLSTLSARAEARPMPPYWLAHAHSLLGNVAYERNELEEAAKWFNLVTAQRYLASSRVYHDAVVGEALVANAKKDRDAMNAALVTSRQWALEVGDPLSRCIAESVELRLAAKSSRATPASSTAPPPDDHMAWWLEIPTVTWAERLLDEDAGGVEAHALPYLEAAIDRMQRAANARQTTALSLIKAMALDKVGREEAGLALLEQVLRDAAPRRLVRTFLDRGPHLKAMLDALAARGEQDEYRDMLRTAFGNAGAGPAPADGGAADPARHLTYRELDVLALLARRFSNKQIAAELSVSPEAIKKRAQAIYRKLGVADRGAAVAVALERHLIDKRH